MLFCLRGLKMNNTLVVIAILITHQQRNNKMLVQVSSQDFLPLKPILEKP
jgi:hypothetical protein